MQRPKLPNNPNLRTAGKLSGLAIQMGATIYFGNLLGVWLETKYHWTHAENWVTLLSVFAAMYLMIKQALSLQK